MYKPLHFLRAHAKNNNPADVSTQVWGCAFEPDCNKEGQYTNIVATCGGGSVCFIDVHTGCVKQKYNSEDLRENFFCLAWSSQRDWGHTMLAVSGTKKRVYIFTSAKSGCVYSEELCSKKHDEAFNSLLFHPKQPNVLFCGSDTGEVVICKINPLQADPLEVLNTMSSIECEIYQFAFNQECSSLLAACSEGLHAWTINGSGDESIDAFWIGLPEAPSAVSRKENSKSNKLKMKLVDTVISLGDGPLIASKRVLEGHILVWDLAKAIAKAGKKNKSNETLCVTQGRFLRWSDSDNYYMGLGWNDNEKLLTCGDDKGGVWFYDLHAVCDNLDLNASPLLHTMKVNWPKKIRDKELDKVRKLSLDTYDIVVAKVVVANKYCVAITNNNMVCIYMAQ